MTCKGTTQSPVRIGSLFTPKCHFQMEWGPHLHSLKKLPLWQLASLKNSNIDHWILASGDFMHSLVDFKHLIIVKWISSQQKFKYLLFNKHLRNANFSSTTEEARSSSFEFRLGHMAIHHRTSPMSDEITVLNFVALHLRNASLYLVSKERQH